MNRLGNFEIRRNVLGDPKYLRGEDAVVGDGANVHTGAIIARGAYVAADATVPAGAIVFNNVRIENGDWFITIGPIGSRKDYLTAVWKKKKREVLWWTGCQRGITTKRLRERIAFHSSRPIAADYRHAIKFVLGLPALKRHIRANTRRSK